jgi:hypothetical protein
MKTIGLIKLPGTIYALLVDMDGLSSSAWLY